MVWIISAFMFLISLCSIAKAVNTSPSGSLDASNKTRDVVDKKELRRIRKMEYQRTYRANNPEKSKAIDAKAREKREKDPIRKEKRRIYRVNYDRQRKQERKKVQQDSQLAKYAKGKRKRVEYEEEQVKPTITRVRTYGKAPKSSAFINPGTSEHLSFEHPSNEERVVPETHKFHKPNVKVRISFPPRRLRSPEVSGSPTS